MERAFPYYRRKGEETMSKEELIQKITESARECNDIPLLDLILKLLRESL